MSHDIEEILSQLRGVQELEEAAEVDDVDGEAEDGEQSESEEQSQKEPAAKESKDPVPGLAKSLGQDQKLADELWKSDLPEAKFLAVRVAEPEKQTLKSLKAWAKAVDSNELADDFARYLVAATDIRTEAVAAFAGAKDALTKRIGFGAIAGVAIDYPDQPSDVYEEWLQTITAGAEDENEEVREAVYLALMEIGKVDEYWHDAAIVLACELQAEGPNAIALGTEAEEALTKLGPVGDRRRIASGNNSRTAKNQNNQGKRRGGGGGGGGGGKNNNRRGRGGQNNNSGSSDAKKSPRRNGRNKRRSRAPAPKAV